MQQYRITEDQFPIIPVEDRQVKWLGGKRGQLVKILRENQTTPSIPDPKGGKDRKFYTIHYAIVKWKHTLSRTIEKGFFREKVSLFENVGNFRVFQRETKRVIKMKKLLSFRLFRCIKEEECLVVLAPVWPPNLFVWIPQNQPILSLVRSVFVLTLASCAQISYASSAKSAPLQRASDDKSAPLQTWCAVTPFTFIVSLCG